MTERARIQRPLTSLVGRTHDLQALTLLVTDPDIRMVTISGAGGIGKTRLALEVADRVRADFDDAVAFVDLVPVKDPGLVPERVLSSIGAPLPESGLAETAVFDFLEDRQMLVVIDNMEHLPGAAPFVSRLLERCSDVVILATMRQRLDIAGEHLYDLLPLTTPDQHGSHTVESIAASEAVQLFLARARAVDRTYALSEENASDVAAICRRLDGLPLAIELAAARVSEIPPRLILRNFARILPFLERAADDPHGRHRTMRNAIEWSYQLLTDDERRLFRRLSVFESGCSIDGARAVGIDGIVEESSNENPQPADISLLNILGSLVDKHFLIRRAWNSDHPRFEMLETIREFGREMLASADDAVAARNRHALHAITMAEEFRSHLQSAESGEWLDRFEEEISELRAAFEWLLQSPEHMAEQALVLSNRLDYFWSWRGHSGEGISSISKALARTDASDTVERATAYLNLGNLTDSNLDESSKYYEASLAILRKLDHKVGIAGLLNSLGLNAEQRGEYAEATVYLNESLERFTELGYESGMALCAYHLGTLAGFQGDSERAIELLDEARTIYDQLEDSPNALFAMVEMGRYYRLWGKKAEAVDILKWALERLTDAKIGQGIRYAKVELGWTEFLSGDLHTSARMFHDVIRLSMSSSKFDGFLMQSICGIANIAIDSGDAERGVSLLSAAERWQSTALLKMPVGDQATILKALERSRKSIHDEVHRECWMRGSLMSIEEASNQALEFIPKLDGTTNVHPVEISKANYKLTPQERNVLCLMAKGEKNRQIAEGLFISERTVAVHVQNILRKLDAGNRTHASAIAFQSGICVDSR